MGSSISIKDYRSLSIIVFLSISSLSFFIICKQHYLYFQQFSYFITNNNFIWNIYAPWPWLSPTITSILDISLTINSLELINKVVYFLNIATESRTQYEISSSLLLTSWIYLHWSNCGSIISPHNSITLVSDSNNLAPMFYRTILSRIHNCNLLIQISFIIFTVSIEDIWLE